MGLERHLLGHAGARPPAQGVVRLGANPELVNPPPRREGGTEWVFAAGPNRFDDPYARYSMRYAATTLRGCLVELLARFRSSHVADAVLAAVTGVEDGPEQYRLADDSGRPDAPLTGRTAQTQDAVQEWMSGVSVVVLRLTGASPVAAAADGALLRELNKHPLVIQALAGSPLSGPTYQQHLEPGVMGLAGPVGRTITNAASRALYELVPAATGWCYRSRLDSEEECWAFYADRVSVRYDPPQRLNSADSLQRAAARSAAAYLEIPLPEGWT